MNNQQVLPPIQLFELPQHLTQYIKTWFAIMMVSSLLMMLWTCLEEELRGHRVRGPYCVIHSVGSDYTIFHVVNMTQTIPCDLYIAKEHMCRDTHSGHRIGKQVACTIQFECPSVGLGIVSLDDFLFINQVRRLCHSMVQVIHLIVHVVQQVIVSLVICYCTLLF